ncbi:ATP synthase F1 subunit gamma [Spirosoma utsteinense]|uniref:ATP synthase gamma chain n=1 Tax=Spirosoma utsteinense TaxID=2585773 RepID=A0ABR6W9N1_9BACT|nr:ATP synthase F1 subunit gamma [Spirosoma utsteinense]MBC3787621.1 F-type H+-transporting ATPase subunit gamma [Spirosoma utsteinense]MBC3793217.1 F-type H+-transporting ATPase subunit gamma [Spirosoma utsteinense]
MASLKEVRARITSINSTQQITKAMKMVAAAKLRRAQDNITQLRPYAQKLSQMLGTVSAGAETAAESPYKQARTVGRALIIVITSDRGLCGAFNTNAVKAALLLIDEKYAALARSGNVEIMAIGKKGSEAFQRRGFPVNTNHIDAFTALNFTTVKAAAEEAMNGFASGRYDVVEIVYNEFKNAAMQIVRTEQMLPIVATPVVGSTAAINYLFEPTEAEIITELIPKTLKTQLYKAVLDSNASEHGARMTAMDKATENAGELLKELRLIYNRTRQAAITTEILEIVGGAEALASA